MLARYKMYRGGRPDDDPMPAGVRQDTRKHTRHCLRPAEELVVAYLAEPSEAAWGTFRDAYLALLSDRFAEDPAPFEKIAELARQQDVHIGCSCPTQQNPDVRHCHTMLALEFMGQQFPGLQIEWPGGAKSA